VLSCLSERFRAMLTSGFSESSAKEIELPAPRPGDGLGGVRHAVFVKMLEYLYTGQVPGPWGGFDVPARSGSGGGFGGGSNDKSGGGCARLPSDCSLAALGDAFARAKDDAIRNGPLGERIAEVTELLEMADQFMLDHLKQVCEVPLCQAVRDITVEELLRVAEGYNALQLQAVCRHHLRNAPHLQEGNAANPSDG